MKLKERWESEKAKRANLIKKAKTQEGAIMHTAISSGTAAGLAVLAGYYDRTEVAGMPLDGVVGAAAHIAAFFVPDMEDTLHAVGDGAMAVFIYREVESMARDRKNNANT